ncbi:heme oxygenase, HugZ family [Campylobacter iguaniorum]|uniref:hypothetical protein n=1 Tax=Campylobacter iguaniorum TaxID=1244531 RepID=UPI0007C9C577|nr:hypothetical protein [Campylobacter iguaniorum]ANE36558.1 heme oxygenase, HugZ family [Campylobacter iguaniorum]
MKNSELTEFIDGFASLSISSFDGKTAHSSYAPCLRDEECFYICVSKLASHYSNLTNYPNQISIIFLEDECKASSVFARKRASFSCDCEQIFDERDAIFDKFIAKFSPDETPKILKNLSDFCIFKLTLKNGRYVKGFGSAYETSGLNITNHIMKK